MNGRVRRDEGGFLRNKVPGEGPSGVTLVTSESGPLGFVLPLENTYTGREGGVQVLLPPSFSLEIFLSSFTLPFI